MIKNSSFKPLWYLKNPHLQTLVANLIHPPFPDVTYHQLLLSDGDTLQLAEGTGQGTDTVLILHGLEGSLKSAYAQRIMNSLNNLGIHAVFMFFRGCNGKPNNKVRSYHSGDTGDLKEVIQHLKKKGSQRIALVGYSLGGNVTLKYLGEEESDDSVVCACAVSVPLLLDICAKRMNRGFSKIYQYELMQRLIRKVKLKRQLLIDAGIKTNPETLRTFIEFDDTFTAPTHGFENAENYYETCSSRQFLKTICKPTLILHSKDDPFMTGQVIPENNELSPLVDMELSSHGGHVGFITGQWLKPAYWIEPRVIKFIRSQFSH